MLGEGNWETQRRVPTLGVIVQGQDSKAETYPQLSYQQNEEATQISRTLSAGSRPGTGLRRYCSRLFGGRLFESVFFIPC